MMRLHLSAPIPDIDAAARLACLHVGARALFPDRRIVVEAVSQGPTRQALRALVPDLVEFRSVTALASAALSGYGCSSEPIASPALTSSPT